MSKFYTGVGHRLRNCTKEGLEFAEWLAGEMAKRGYTVISGDADGIDWAFSMGSGEQCKVYLPREGFGKYVNRDDSKRIVLTPEEGLYADEKLLELGILPEIATMFSHSKAYHRRNFFQSWNHGELPEVCFYYAKETNGVIEGGTRTAVYTARHFGIPDYNFYTSEGRELIRRLLEEGEWN